MTAATRPGSTAPVAPWLEVLEGTVSLKYLTRSGLKLMVVLTSSCPNRNHLTGNSYRSSALHRAVNRARAVILAQPHMITIYVVYVDNYQNFLSSCRASVGCCNAFIWAAAILQMDPGPSLRGLPAATGLLMPP